MRSVDGSDHIGIVAAHAQRQQQITRLPQRAHLAGKLLADIAMAGHGHGQRRIRRQRHGSQLGAFALKPTDAESRKLLCMRHRRAVAASQNLAATGNAGQYGLHRIGDRFAKGLRGLVFQVGAVDEVLLDALL